MMLDFQVLASQWNYISVLTMPNPIHRIIAAVTLVTPKTLNALLNGFKRRLCDV